MGTSKIGIPKPSTLEEVEKVKWAARYLSCADEINNECKKYRYNGTCWIDRPDFTPPTNQKKEPGGRAGWHPGNREHQIMGRQIAWLLLRAISEVLTEWKDAPNYELPDKAWHVTEMYENTRAKLALLDPSTTACKSFNKEDQNRTYYCTIPWKVRGILILFTM